MSLTLGRQGGIAQPLKKRTVGQTNIAHVYDGANHIWPTSVIHFSDFTSVQLKEFGMLLMLKLHHLHKNNKICFLIKCLKVLLHFGLKM
nr:MAG: hypothetical protein [Bacteriophage sp.]